MRNTSLFVFLFKFGLFVFIALMPKMGLAQEICNNSIDDDGNGLIDLNDPNCTCEIIDYQSIISNPSFETYNCCPTGPGQMTCVNDWSQASAGTIDYLNLCAAWAIDPFYAPPLPIPDGDACLRLLDGVLKRENEWITHKEYAGVCLNESMLADSLYLFELYVGFREESESPDFNISIYGTNNCVNLPFSTGENYDCPLEGSGFELLNSKVITNGSGNLWKKVSIELIPEQAIAAIVIGPDCASIESKESYVYYLDDFVLNKKSAFDFRLLEMNTPCSSDFLFAVKDNPIFMYQWYKEGIALVGETAAQLSTMYGEGRYQVRITDNISCRVSDDYIYTIPVYTNSVTQIICEEEEFLFGDNWLSQSGVYEHTFVSSENCDSVVTLNLEVKANTIDSLQVQIVQGATFEFNAVAYHSQGIYPIYLTNMEGCDSLVVLQLSVSNIAIPNAFTPNGDGINDVFRISGAEEDIADITLSIYNRWGEQIFVGKEWDGRRASRLLNAGVFVYVVEITTTWGEEAMYYGHVTLVR